MKFWKVQSVGNDFPLICLDDVAESDLAGLAIRLCDRHFGVGGDGLLGVKNLGSDRVLLRMFNPDGTEDFCGNGIRCAAQFSVEQGWVGSEFVIRHLDQEVSIEERSGEIVTHLAPASYEPSRVPHVMESELFDAPIGNGLRGSALTTGSTHTIIPVNNLPESPEFERISAEIEHDSRFPDRTSVIWVQELEPDHLKIRIWERGVGETFGCGTGTSAAVADYLRRAGRGGEVLVENPGGDLRVGIDRWDGPVRLVGVAAVLFAGHLSDL